MGADSLAARPERLCVLSARKPDKISDRQSATLVHGQHGPRDELGF